MPIEEVLTSFIGQFYDNKPPPRLVLLSHAVLEPELVAEALSIRAGRKVELLVPQRGEKARLVGHALDNAREALGRRLAESASQHRLLEGVATALGLPAPPERIEVYDNSHIQGTNAVGAMIVAGPEGFIKNAYRKFNMRGVGAASAHGDFPPPLAGEGGVGEAAAPVTSPTEVNPRTPRTPLLDPPPQAGEEKRDGAGDGQSPWELASLAPGDDYGMMREMLTRRFARAVKEDPDRSQGSWPDLILIDGGAGQLSSAMEVLAELGIDDVAVAAIAKGPDRNAGRERFFLPGKAPFSLEPRDPVLYFLQRLRDEAHRFAIGTHRAKRAKAIGQSLLDEIPGIGAQRKKALLHYFGSARSVARAGLAELERVEGISTGVAKKIYRHFHADG
jgi:excinuclease ABC subunit C